MCSPEPSPSPPMLLPVQESNGRDYGLCTGASRQFQHSWDEGRWRSPRPSNQESSGPPVTVLKATICLWQAVRLMGTRPFSCREEDHTWSRKTLFCIIPKFSRTKGWVGIFLPGAHLSLRRGKILSQNYATPYLHHFQLLLAGCLLLLQSGA